MHRLASDCEEQQAVIAQRQSEIADLEGRRAELERGASGALEKAAFLRTLREAASQKLTQQLARLAALEERHRAAAAVVERFDSLVEEMRQRVGLLRSQMSAAFGELLQRSHENQQLGEQLVEQEAEHNAGQARDGLLQFESEQVRARLTEIDQALHETRGLLEQARDRRAEASTAAAKLQSDAQYLAETCLNELGLERESLLADASLPVVSGEQLAFEDQACRDMRARLESMGPVNMMALEEYKETAERHSFLETQRKDLMDSIENTLATIKEIDVFSRQKFQEAFGKINENFQTTFKKLFGGGHAFMRLTDEENSAESGIDVVASPPGKKLQNVLLLSGGEKALTALSLLVGIFQYQPSPFCILDEVDAPLDEANIGRFTELVKEMSVQTQFVLITHSKKTMSIAPVLYGVTMQEPGVSKLVSVRFGATA
jgi:chromosome segregation protein